MFLENSEAALKHADLVYSKDIQHSLQVALAEMAIQTSDLRMVELVGARTFIHIWLNLAEPGLKETKMSGINLDQ